MRKPLQESEAKLFRESVQGAEPIRINRTEPFRHRRLPKPISQPPELAKQPGRVTIAEAEIETGDYLLFARPGVQKRLLADLDLHGLRTAHAEGILGEFLGDCTRRGVRCALVVHGKGYRSDGRQPVLKHKVNYWLRLYEQVLAFCSATRRDGGTGAVYLLLRNPKKSQRKNY
jgi:DNA-nicking Smr family endonuclease